MSGGEAFGAVVVQTYTENIRYSQRDQEVLTFVSQHIGIAVNRKRAEEALIESEEKYRTLWTKRAQSDMA